MVDAWLLILTIGGTVALLLANIYLFLLYSHPSDNKDGVGWFGRIVVIAGSFIICAFIMLLPLDIANSRGSGGGINTDIIY